MIEKLSRQLFNDAVGDPVRRKALAMAIYLKDHNITSVFKNWSYRDLGRAAGLSPTTAKKYVEELRKMHLVREDSRDGVQYLVFKKLRRSKIKNKYNDKFHTPKTADIALSKLDRSSVSSIEKSLMSLVVVEDTAKKDYLRRLIKLGTNPSKSDPVKAVKKARMICRKRGLEEFNDGGLSYKGIARKLKCGLNMVKRIIDLGQQQGMFWVEKPELVLVKYIGKNQAKFALSFFKGEFPNAFATSNNIYYQPALRFHLSPS